MNWRQMLGSRKRSGGLFYQRHLVCEHLEHRLMLSGFQSDDFSSLDLNSELWTFIDPVGDSSVVLNGTNALISVPAGQSHDLWTAGNMAPRLLQPIDNEDFEIEVKFESTPLGSYAAQGILVEADADNYLRFDFVSVGTRLDVFSASFASGAPTVRYRSSLGDSSPNHLRVCRVGHLWTQAYSDDGNTWITAAEFSHVLDVSVAGVFAGNAGSNPAFTSSVDYVFNTQSPIAPEDPDPSLDDTPPVLSDIQSTVSNNSLTVTFATDDLSYGAIEYGLTSQYELGSSSVGNLGQVHSITLDELRPLTTYAIRASATNLAGHVTYSEEMFVRTGPASEQKSPVIDVWYGADYEFAGPGPQRWINILGRTFDEDGIHSLAYSLNSGPQMVLSVGPNGTRLESAGDFNIEIARDDLVVGHNTIVLSATDNLGSQSSETVNVHYIEDHAWPPTDAADWDSVSRIADVADVVDGLWTLTDSGVRTVETGYDRLIALGSVFMSDFEVEVPITIHSFDPNGTSGPPGVGVIARWSGHFEDQSQPNVQWWPLGGLGWYRGGRLRITGNGSASIAQSDLRELPPNVTHILKLRVESNEGAPSTYSLKVWQQGESEPQSWDITGQGVAGELDTGSILLVAHHTDATFGNVAITPIPDGLAPAITVDATASTTAITLNADSSEAVVWTVDYGHTSSYELGSAGPTLPSTGQQLTIPDLTPATTYYLHVTATDASGDSSSQDLIVDTRPAGGQLVSDEFSTASVDTSVWTIIDPVGDALVAQSGGRLEIAVPAGVSHDVWTSGILAPRVMQSVSDLADFEIEVRFDNQPSGRYALSGLLLEADNGDRLRFDFYSASSSSLRIFAASFHGNSPTVRYDQGISVPTGAPLTMRVARQGDVWTQRYSWDGQNWTDAAQFAYDLDVRAIGPFAGNAGGMPAHTAAIDYFRDVSTSLPDTTPPVFSSLSTKSTATSVTVSGSTNEPATWTVDYGFTSNYELGSVGPTLPSTSQQLTIRDLTPATTYYLHVTATDTGGNSSSQDLIVDTRPAGGRLVSDDFNRASLDTSAWTIVDRVGDASVAQSGGQLRIAVPAGVSHDVWTGGMRAPWVMQSVGDLADFEMEVRFENQPSGRHALSGLLLEADNGERLRFDFHSTSSSSLRIFAASFQGNSPTVRHNQGISVPAGVPLTMRVARQGDVWTQRYSWDGQNWTDAARFAYDLDVSGIGLFAGNAGNLPANTAAIDYFRILDGPTI